MFEICVLPVKVRLKPPFVNKNLVVDFKNKTGVSTDPLLRCDRLTLKIILVHEFWENEFGSQLRTRKG